MIIGNESVSCPNCGWEPRETDLWICDVCNTKWNTFETHAKCPGCGKIFADTQCKRSSGGCGQMSPHADWYKSTNLKSQSQPKKFTWFWQSRNEPPITENDKLWVEDSLLWLNELFTPEVFRSLVTITPDKQYFERNFSGSEDDADFILQRVAELMNIKPWEITLNFFSENPTRFSEGITATPSEGIKGGWKPRGSELVDKGFGNKEIWVDMEQLHDPVALVATISVELAEYKLISEYAINENVEMLADFTSLMYGFGIFRANSYFKFSQWQGSSHQGWGMKKRGGLPEPIIAYVMAWLAFYRKENTSWKHYLNRTVRKYFERSLTYIEQNADGMKWVL
jgi:hypothetical protein